MRIRVRCFLFKESEALITAAGQVTVVATITTVAKATATVLPEAAVIVATAEGMAVALVVMEGMARGEVEITKTTVPGSGAGKDVWQKNAALWPRGTRGGSLLVCSWTIGQVQRPRKNLALLM